MSDKQKLADYRTMIAAAPEPAVLSDAAGVMVAVNEGLAKLLNVPARDLPGQPFFRYFTDALNRGAGVTKYIEITDSASRTPVTGELTVKNLKLSVKTRQIPVIARNRRYLLSILTDRDDTAIERTVRPVLIIFDFYQLGDGMLSLPFLRGALTRYEVFACCTPNVAELYAICLPEVKTIVYRPFWRGRARTKPRADECAGMIDCIKKIRRLRPAATVSILPDPRAHFLMACSGADERIGFKTNDQNIWAPGYLPKRRMKVVAARAVVNAAQAISRHRWLTRELTREKPTQAQWKNWRQVSDVLHLPWRDEFPWFRVEVPIGDRETTAFLAAAKAANRRVCLAHPGARTNNRRWPGNLFAEVIKRHYLPQGDAVLIIDSGEGNTPRVTDASCRIWRPGGLAEFLSVLAQADEVLCNDSFPAHAAAALGKKVYAIFSAQDAEWFGPYRNEHRVIRKNVCEFMPCLDYCRKPSYVCLEAITPDDVLNVMARQHRAAEI